MEQTDRKRNYNNDTFSDTQLNAIVENIDRLIRFQSRLLEILKDYLPSIQDREQPQNFGFLFQLLVKIRLNTESLNLLFEKVKNDVRFKTTVNLIYRSIIDDVINILYLISFIDDKDQNQTTLGNEVQILERDFVDALIVITRAEDSFFRKHNIPREFDLDKSLDVIRTDWKCLFDIENSKTKSNKQIRESSNIKLTEGLKDTGKHVKETDKLSRIASHGFDRCDYILVLFRYFSQFQHFSPLVHTMTLNDLSIDMRHYEWTFIEMANVSGIICQLLKSNKSATSLDGIKELLEEFITRS